VLASVYQIPAYSNVPDRVLNTQTGTMTTPSGHVISFTCEAHVGRMLLTVDGHEGWVYALTAPMAQAIDLPDTTKPATGTFTRGTQVTSFTLPANPGGAQWNAMTLTAPGGITGTYALTLPLTGTGTVKQAGQILMTVQWGGSGAVTATMADGLSEVGEPSGAARDFLVDRWLWALADAGPNPR
jgi:hypothetical protein